MEETQEIVVEDIDTTTSEIPAVDELKETTDTIVGGLGTTE